MVRQFSKCLGVATLFTLLATPALALPRPGPDGYVYRNTTPGTLAPAGTLIDQLSQTIWSSPTVSGPTANVGTLTSSVYRNGPNGSLDFLYKITPAGDGETLQSLDVPWINNEVLVEDSGFNLQGGGTLTPASISRFSANDPLTFLFDTPPGNLDAGTADLVVHTNAHAYTFSDVFTVRTIDPSGQYLFSDGLLGLIPEHAPEPGTLALLAASVPLLMARRRRRS